MKHLILAAAVAVTVLCVNAQPAPAAGYAPWCAVSSMGRGGAYWDCRYATLDQCVPFVVRGQSRLLQSQSGLCRGIGTAPLAPSP